MSDAGTANRTRRSCAPPTRRSSSGCGSRTCSLQTVVSLLNLGGRKAGLAPGTEDERDPEQLRLAIEGARALLPLVEPALGAEAAQIRDALSQLQMAYAQTRRRRRRRRPARPGAGTRPPEPPDARGWSGAGAGVRPALGPGPVAPRDASVGSRL